VTFELMGRKKGPTHPPNIYPKPYLSPRRASQVPYKHRSFPILSFSPIQVKGITCFSENFIRELVFSSRLGSFVANGGVVRVGGP
jgi:hypothetical protein